MHGMADRPASIVLDRPLLYAADEGVLLDYAFSGCRASISNQGHLSLDHKTASLISLPLN